jgi:hypothetical protein
MTRSFTRKLGRLHHQHVIDPESLSEVDQFMLGMEQMARDYLARRTTPLEEETPPPDVEAAAPATPSPAPSPAEAAPAEPAPPAPPPPPPVPSPWDWQPMQNSSQDHPMAAELRQRAWDASVRREQEERYRTRWG